jgi:putative DNA primase/helicase
MSKLLPIPLFTQENLPEEFKPHAKYNQEAEDFEQIKDFVFGDVPFEYSEHGNALRFKALTKGIFVFISTLEKYALYKDGRWQLDEDQAIYRAWDWLLQNLKDEVQFYNKLLKQLNRFDEEEFSIKPLEKRLLVRIKDVTAHYKTCQRKATIKASLELFSTRKGVTVPLNTFDSKGHFIGCKNGIVDLRTGNLIQHDQSYMMMKSTAVFYVPEATCPNFLKFLDETFQGNTDLIDHMHCYLGAALFGAMKEIFQIWIGKGLNGKSLLVDLTSAVMGDYSTSAHADLFTVSSKNKDPFMASLFGIRLVTLNETDKGDKLDKGLLKSCTNSGLVTARSLYSNPISFQPVFTPVLCTNFMPYISTDEATWNRIQVIPFNNRVSDEDKDPNLKQKLLKEEGEGIFNWLVQGAMKHYENLQDNFKPAVPDVVIKETEKYQDNFDKISHYLRDRCVETVSPKDGLDLKCKVTELRKGYELWAKYNGYYAHSTHEFRSELVKKGYRIYNGELGLEWVKGIGINHFGDTEISLILPKELTETEKLMDI